MIFSFLAEIFKTAVSATNRQLYRSEDPGLKSNQYFHNWEQRFQGATSPILYSMTALVLLIPLVSLYYMSPEAARIPYVLTYAILFAAIVYVTVKKQNAPTTAMYLGISQVAFIGHAFALRVIMVGAPDLENSAIACTMFACMGFLFIVLTYYSNKWIVGLAIEHLCLAYFAWGPNHPEDRKLAWMLMLLSFDAFAVVFKLIDFRRRRRYAALEQAANDLRTQNERLKFEAVEKEMLFAQEIQDSLAPKFDMLTSGPWQVRFFHRRYAILGGDWMGARVLSNGDLILAVADVTGKGVAASMVAQAIHTLWAQELPRQGFDPLTWLRNVNQTLYVMGHTKVHTATIGLSVLSASRLTHYSCAHVPLFIGKTQLGTKHYAPLVASGDLVGLNEHIDLRAASADLQDPAIESILLGTDGIFDRGGRTKSRKIAALLEELDAEGSEALTRGDVEDDKLLIWVQRVPTPAQVQKAS
ncbi:MAG: SpoIIE family protein phosphatase [Proteobacteria bacterium]|nr:SpoIIE family protein phosphatase [Pseudomonadota bacterium]